MKKDSTNKDKKEIHKEIPTEEPTVLTTYPCHGLNVQVPANSKHIMQNPRVVPIMWGHFYFINGPNGPNGDYQSAVKQMIIDLVTRSNMNGLAQYGIQRASVDDPIIIDTGGEPDPTNLSRQDIQTELLNWLTNGTVLPRPLVDEKNLEYIIFLPLGSTLSNAEPPEWGYHCPNVSPCPSSSKFNPSSSDNDLFWAVIVTNISANPGINSTSASSFAATTAYFVAHELTEAFTDRDGNGFITNTTMTVPGCEINDICESSDPSVSNGIFTNYLIDGRVVGVVGPIWSNWDSKCIYSFAPISIKKFLSTFSPPIDGSRGLFSQLNTPTINVDFVARVVAAQP